MGLTPVAALGSRDQHSYLQLIQEGVRDKQVVMLGVEEIVPAPPPVEPLADWPEFPGIYLGHSLHSVQHKQMVGTSRALVKDGVPVDLFSLKKLDVYHLGYFYALWMVLTGALADQWEINAFDQPGVEASKRITRELLGPSAPRRHRFFL